MVSRLTKGYLRYLGLLVSFGAVLGFLIAFAEVSVGVRFPREVVYPFAFGFGFAVAWKTRHWILLREKP